MSWCLDMGLVGRAHGGDLLSLGISSSQPASKFWRVQKPEFSGGKNPPCPSPSSQWPLNHHIHHGPGTPASPHHPALKGLGGGDPCSPHPTPSPRPLSPLTLQHGAAPTSSATLITSRLSPASWRHGPGTPTCSPSPGKWPGLTSPGDDIQGSPGGLG